MTLRRLGFLGALGLLVAPLPASAQSLRTVPLDHWSYGIVEELLLRDPELGRDLRLASRPWRESDFVTIAERARAGAAAGTVPAGYADLLARTYLPETAANGHENDRLAPWSNFSEVSPRYEGSFGDDATFDPAFLPPRFGDEEADSAGVSGYTPHRFVLQHDLAAQLGERVALVWRYALDSYVRSDPTRFRQIEIRGDEDYGFAVLDAFVTVHWPHVTLTAGRSDLALGPGRATSILLSDSIPGLDQFRFELDARTGRFMGVIARLSGDLQNRSLDENGEALPGSLPPAEGLRRVDRLLYLHRVEWYPHPRAYLALSEGALVAGIDRGLELRYAQLLVPFAVTQEDEDEPDGTNVNLMAAVEGSMTFAPGIRAYAMGVAQEFFLDSREREEIGNQLAWRLGGVVAGDLVGLPAFTAGAEYTRVDVFTYLHRGLNTNWTTYGVPLGSSLGPDADQALGWITWRPRPDVRLTADAMIRRGGERSVATLESVVDAGNLPFPSGVVQRERRVGVEGWAMLPDWGVEGFARASLRDVDNVGNEEGTNDRFWLGNVGLRYRTWLGTRR
jgi:hypothetical protein